MIYFILSGAVRSILDLCRTSLRKLRKLRKSSSSPNKIKKLKNESNEILEKTSRNKEKKIEIGGVTNHINIDIDKYDSAEVEKEVEADIYFLLQNAVGIFSVLEFSLLGILTHGSEIRKLQKRQKKISKEEKEKEEKEKFKFIEIPKLKAEDKKAKIIPKSSFCLYCNLSVANSSRCSRCKGSYCNRSHQKLHWNVHKVSTLEF